MSIIAIWNTRFKRVFTCKRSCPIGLLMVGWVALGLPIQCRRCSCGTFFSPGRQRRELIYADSGVESTAETVELFSQKSDRLLKRIKTWLMDQFAKNPSSISASHS